MPAWALEAGSRPELSGRWRSEVLDTQVDAVDQEGGEDKRTEVLSVVWSLTQSVSSMNHNLPGAHLLLC